MVINKKIKRLVVTTLSLSMVASLLAACGNSEPSYKSFRAVKEDVVSLTVMAMDGSADTVIFNMTMPDDTEQEQEPIENQGDTSDVRVVDSSLRGKPKRLKKLDLDAEDREGIADIIKSSLDVVESTEDEGATDYTFMYINNLDASKYRNQALTKEQYEEQISLLDSLNLDELDAITKADNTEIDFSISYTDKSNETKEYLFSLGGVTAETKETLTNFMASTRELASSMAIEDNLDYIAPNKTNKAIETIEKLYDEYTDARMIETRYTENEELIPMIPNLTGLEYEYLKDKVTEMAVSMPMMNVNPYMVFDIETTEENCNDIANGIKDKLNVENIYLCVQPEKAKVVTVKSNNPDKLAKVLIIMGNTDMVDGLEGAINKVYSGAEIESTVIYEEGQY